MHHSNPAAVKTLSRPSHSACCVQDPNPGQPSRGCRGHFAALDDSRGRAKILDTRIGARADEHRIDGNIAQRRDPISESALHSLALTVIVSIEGSGTLPVDRQYVLRAGRPVTCGAMSAALIETSNIDFRPGCGGAASSNAGPPSRKRPPSCKGPAFQIFEGHFVGRDQAGAGARLDRHVADGHPPRHREFTDGRSRRIR